MFLKEQSLKEFIKETTLIFQDKNKHNNFGDKSNTKQETTAYF